MEPSPCVLSNVRISSISKETLWSIQTYTPSSTSGFWQFLVMMVSYFTLSLSHAQSAINVLSDTEINTSFLDFLPSDSMASQLYNDLFNTADWFSVPVLSLLLLFIISLLVILNLIKKNRLLQDLKPRYLALQQELSNRKEHLELVLKSAKAGTFQYRATNKDLQWDQRGISMLGMKQERLDGTYEPWFEIIHPNDLAEVKEAMDKLLIGVESTLDVEYRIQQSDGQCHFINTLASAHYSPNGKIDCISGLIFDVTKVRNAQLKLQTAKELAEDVANELLQEKEKAQQYIDLVESIIVALDPNGNITLINRKGCQIFGFPAERLIGKNWFHNCLPPGEENLFQLRAHITIMEGNVEGEEYSENQILLADKTQRMIAWHTAYVRENGQITGILSVGTDITERKNAEEALIAAKEEAEAANRAKSTFLANMSHEIRTPMNAILGFSAIMRKKVYDPELKSDLDAISNAGKNLLQLINDILDLSRVEAGKLELLPMPMDIRTLAFETEQIFKLRLDSKQLTFSVHVSSDIPKLLVLDEVRIRQILLNLVGNAIKFTEKGFIKLIIEPIDTIDPEASHIGLRIIVKDSGRGISPSMLIRIFDSFEQQEKHDARRSDGAGLGLAICKRLVAMMHGEIHAESEQGKGSQFIVALPLVPVTANQPSEEENSDAMGNEQIVFDPATILVVDDVESNLILIEAYLADTGLKTVAAINGRDALDKAAIIQPDVILMDLRMPEMDGEEALAELQNDLELCHIPVIAVTASVMQSDILKLKEQGFYDVLFKPVHLGDLLFALSMLLPHQRAEMGTLVAKTGIQLTSTQSESLLERLPELEGKYLKWWKEVNESCQFGEIESFALALKNDAELALLGPLVNYAKNLLNCAAAFDVLNIKAQLALYPQLLEQLKGAGERSQPIKKSPDSGDQQNG